MAYAKDTPFARGRVDGHQKKFVRMHARERRDETMVEFVAERNSVLRPRARGDGGDLMALLLPISYPLDKVLAVESHLSISQTLPCVCRVAISLLQCTVYCEASR